MIPASMGGGVPGAGGAGGMNNTSAIPDVILKHLEAQQALNRDPDRAGMGAQPGLGALAAVTGGLDSESSGG